MEKIVSFLKGVNKFGLGVILITGLWIFGSEMVNANSKQATRYYWYDSDGSGSNPAAWHTTPPDDELNLSCETNNLRICSADFTSAPTSTDNLVSSNMSSTARTNGNYQ